MPLTPPRTNTGQRVPFSLCPRTGERVRASRSLHRVNYFKDAERSEHRVLVDDSRRVRELSFPGVKRRRPLHSSERFAAGDFSYSLFRGLPRASVAPGGDTRSRSSKRHSRAQTPMLVVTAS